MYIPPKDKLDAGHMMTFSFMEKFTYAQYADACARNKILPLHEDTYNYNYQKLRTALVEFLGVPQERYSGAI